MERMTTFFDIVGRVSWLLAVVAKLLIGLLILFVVSDVVARNLGMRALTWAISASEYSLLYLTFLSMPWLVRNKGHVFVVFLRGLLPPAGRALLEKLMYIACIVLCLYLGWIAATSLSVAVAKGTYETRTFDMPKWAVFLPIMLGFGLSALEWLRFLLTPVSMYDINPTEMEGM
jgi:TRAP-type C4-dicarboxylate transport system permease small subunit